MSTRFYKTAITVCLILLSPYVLAESVFRLNVLSNGNAVESGLAVLVADGLVLSSSGLVSQGGQWVVEDAATGASLIASLSVVDQENDLVLLNVNGLTGEPVLLAQKSSEIGRIVSLLLLDGTRLGTIHSQLESTTHPLRIRHTGLVAEDEYAAPLMNNCDELIGVSQNNKRSFSNRLKADSEFGVVGRLSDLKLFLQRNDIPYNTADKICISEVELLRAAEARTQAREAELLILEQEQLRLEEERTRLLAEQETLATENQARLDELAEENQARLDELAEREEELAKNQAAIELAEIERKEMESKQAELETQAQAQEEALVAAAQLQKQERRQQLYRLLGLSGLLVALLVFAYMQVQRRKKSQQDSDKDINQARDKTEKVQAELQKVSATFSDVLLIGTDSQGTEHKLKINGNALIRAEFGQIIGRSAQYADYVLSLEDVSRKHLRISIKENNIYIEDLQTVNGSAINGKDLVAGETCILSNGDVLRIGLLVCKVHLIKDS